MLKGWPHIKILAEIRNGGLLQRMKAARLAGPKHFEIVDTEMPTLVDGQCLVKL